MATSKNIKAASTPKAESASKKEAPAADKSASTDASKASDATKTADTPKSESADGGAPKNYSRGEGQKVVTQSYRDNWNDIFGK
jgi:hypothetical protein